MEESPLLGEPTFVSIGEGRLRCVETGHELREADKANYAKTKSCLATLFDLALSRARFPLNFFEQSTTNKNQIICKLTGAVVNKNEAAVWKHVTGKKFAQKLDNKKTEQKDASAMPSDDAKAVVQGNASEELVTKKKQKKEKKKKTKNKKQSESNGAMDVVDEELDFWMPPENQQQDASVDKDEDMVLDADEDGEDEMRVKRSAMAVGPSSFASRKKKRKTKS